MIPSHGVFLVHREQYQDLLREAQQERLIQAAGLRSSNKLEFTRQTANWLSTHVVRLGLQLQAYRLTGPTCCSDCCLVELKASTPT